MKKLAIVTCVVGLSGLAGVSVAQPKPDAKKVDPKVDTKKAEPKMEAPKPAAETTALAKQLAGTVKCTGKGFMPDGSSIDMTGTSTTKADLDGFWIRESFTGKMKVGGFKYEAFTNWDASSKKWRRIFIDSMGGYMVGWSDGPKDGKVDFVLDGQGAMGAFQFKDHTDMSDAKAGVKSWGERSMDKGKTWIKDYEVTCKK